MSAAHHEEEHSSFIKTPQQLIVVIVVGFLVPIAIAVMASQFFTSGIAVSQDNPAMSPEAVAKRLKPVGELAVADAGAPKAARSGEEIVKTICAACHESGALGAPKIGDSGSWKKRLAQGLDRVTENAIKGVRQMPARGGNPDLSDTDVALAVIYMANKSGAGLKEPAKAAAAQPAPAKIKEKPAAAAAVAAADSGKGKSVFDANCGACHNTGAAGAPKLGDKAAWGPRVATGKPSLYNSALKGKNAMPPKGGNASLADGDVKAAVDYMVSQAK